MTRAAYLALVVVGGFGCHTVANVRREPSSRADAPTIAVRSPDDPISWLREHAAPIRLPPFDDGDFTDLEPLRSVVGNAKIVALGEQSHGDGTTFRTKARLVRYLHEKLGFDVLMFEAAMLDCDVAASALSRGSLDPIATVGTCVPTLWSRAEELKPLIAYLGAQPQSARPLELAGFDLVSRSRTVDVLRGEFRELGAEEASNPEPWQTLQSAFVAIRQQKTDALAPLESAAHDGVRRLRDRLRAQPPSERVRFVDRALLSADSFLTYWCDSLLRGAVDGGAQRAISSNLRDETMAENAIWLAENRYRGKKIILWGASYHFLRAHESIEPLPSLDYRGAVMMGERLAERFHGDYVAIAAIADEGRVALRNGETVPLDPHGDDAIESMLAHAELENAIVDLHADDRGAAWLHRPFIAGPLGYAYMRARWDQSFDAFVFNRHMAPAVTLTDAKPSGVPDGGTDAAR